MMSFSKRTVVASLFAAALLFPALPLPAAAATPQSAQVQQNPGNQVVVTVNGKKITQDDLDTATNNLMPLVTYHNAVSEDRLKGIQKKALENIINSELIYKYAKDNKLDKVDKKEIDQQVKDLKKKLPKGDSLDKVLKRSNLTLDELKGDFKKDIVVVRVSKVKTEEFRKKAAESVNDSFLLDYYKKNMDKFKEPEKMHLRSILIKADPSGGQRVWNESRKKAEEISKLAKEGTDFAKLATERSEDPFAKNGGDMGWAHKGSLFPEIEEAAGKLKVGEVSGPVMTIYGYHILKMEARKPSVQKKFEELNQKNLEHELEEKEFKNLWNGWLDGIRKASKVEYLKKFD
jgi:parvulin-like peptidyl-prolyl isomerase